MTTKQIIQLGFRRRLGEESIYSLFLGGDTFIHCFVKSETEFRIFLWYGHNMDFHKCVCLWSCPKNIEDLKKLIQILSGQE